MGAADGGDAVRMWSRRPGPGLPGVLRLAGFEERAGGAVARRELPSAGVPVILGLGESIGISSAAGRGSYTSFVAGMHEIPVHTVHGGELRCVQVDLDPLAAYRLFGVPLSELRDTVLAVDQLPGRAWPELAGRLADAPDWRTRFALVECALGTGLRDGREPDPEVRWAWRRLAGAHGGVPVAALADEVGWSRRHLSARFRHQVGLAPKQAASVLRFDRARALLGARGGAPDGPSGPMSGRPGPRIADVAAEAGYADHSHLVREFRRLAGVTPTELLAEG